MKTNRSIQHMLMVGSLALIAWLPALPTHAADQASGAAIIFAPVENLDVMASGAAEDTLKACMARVPTDASAGQRMIAEQGCTRDEETRTLIQAVPAQ